MILCCGEALIDMVPVDPSAEQLAYTPLSGGAIYNTAIALGRLEIPVQLLSGVSNDLFGEQLASGLGASNVGTKLLIRSDRPTTLAFVKLQDGHANYTFYDENSAGGKITKKDLPDLPVLSALYFGGISLCTEPAASVYEYLALREASDTVLMVDPNIRQSFIKDEAAYRARLDRILTQADIIKVSDEDLDWIEKGPEAHDAKLAQFCKRFGGLVIVTKGSEGAVAYVQGALIAQVKPPKTIVKDTVGAGDTFNAGFLASLHSEDLLDKHSIANIGADEIANALDYASKVAAITVSRSGANPPFLKEL